MGANDRSSTSSNTTNDKNKSESRSTGSFNVLERSSSSLWTRSTRRGLWAMICIVAVVVLGSIIFSFVRAPAKERERPISEGASNYQGDRTINSFHKTSKIELNKADCGRLVEAHANISGRIVNGKPARGAFPWTVIIYAQPYNSEELQGTGALITKLHVLTAAHVVPLDKKIMSVYVKYGSSVVDDMKFVKAIAVNDRGFDRATAKHDIMVVLLAEPLDAMPLLCVPSRSVFTLGKMKPEQLPKAKDKLVVAGFGLPTEPYDMPSVEVSELMYTTGIVLPMRSCPYPERSQTEFCMQEHATGICSGDSGASAMMEINGRLTSLGVVSTTLVCGKTPDRYIRVSGHIDWLYDTINGSPANFTKLPNNSSGTIV